MLLRKRFRISSAPSPLLPRAASAAPPARLRDNPGLLAMLVLLANITFLDRICISVAGARMQQDLGIGPQAWGWVLGVFVFSYGLFEIPMGAWGDRVGHRRVLARIVFCWSLFTMLTGVVNGLWPLLAVRFLFGIGEAGAYPNIAGVVAKAFPRRKAVAQGFVWAASRAGGALAPLLTVPLQVAYGWRAAFWVYGLVGLLWCAVWWRGFLQQAPNTEAAETPAHRPAPWGQLLRAWPLWTLMGMYGCYAFASWFYFSWLPVWLTKGRGFTEAEMGLLSALPFVFGATGCLVGGFVGDLAVQRLGSRWGRVAVGAGCLGVASLLLVATALVENRSASVWLLSVGFGVLDLMLPSAWALAIDLAGPYAGAVSGAMNMAGQLGGFLCTVLFGYVVAATGNYNLPLYGIAAMVATSAFLFTRLDGSRPILESDEAPALRAPGHS